MTASRLRAYSARERERGQSAKSRSDAKVGRGRAAFPAVTGPPLHLIEDSVAGTSAATNFLSQFNGELKAMAITASIGQRTARPQLVPA